MKTHADPRLVRLAQELREDAVDHYRTGIRCCGLKPSIARDTVLSCIQRNVASTGMRVLNVVNGVFVRARSQQIQISAQVESMETPDSA